MDTVNDKLRDMGPDHEGVLEFMTPRQALDYLYGKLKTIIDLKNHDYGTEEDVLANFRMCETAGLCDMETGVLIRMMDKVSRVATFINKGTLAAEGYEDALMDIIGYTAILMSIYTEKN